MLYMRFTSELWNCVVVADDIITCIIVMSYGIFGHNSNYNLWYSFHIFSQTKIWFVLNQFINHILKLIITKFTNITIIMLYKKKQLYRYFTIKVQGGINQLDAENFHISFYSLLNYTFYCIPFLISNNVFVHTIFLYCTTKQYFKLICNSMYKSLT